MAVSWLKDMTSIYRAINLIEILKHTPTRFGQLVSIIGFLSIDVGLSISPSAFSPFDSPLSEYLPRLSYSHFMPVAAYFLTCPDVFAFVSDAKALEARDKRGPLKFPPQAT